MQYTPQPLEAYNEIAEKVRSGEYFREARTMYDITIHDPMAERYFYVLITAISTLILVLALYAADSLYPLKTPVPFVYNVQNPVEDLPNIKPLRVEQQEAPDYSVLRFLVITYVTQREEYNITTLDRNLSSVKSQTAREAYEEFEQSLDPHNPESPVTLYQRHSSRSVEVLSVTPVADSENEVTVVFEATVSGKTDVKKSLWQANIAFSYSGLGLDDREHSKPISFIVTKYRVKRLQDTK